MNLSQFNLQFKLLGIPICVMPSFWVLCVVFSPFMTLHTEADRPWLFGAAGWILALLASFLLHELGHALSARKFFKARPEIALGVGQSPSGASVFGGVTSWSRVDAIQTTAKKRAFVSVSGPAVAFSAAILGLVVALATGSRLAYRLEFGILPVLFPAEWVAKIDEFGALDLFVGYFSYGFFWINIFWSVVNMLPIYPLDGGQALMAFAKNATGARNMFYVSIACAILVGGLFLTEQNWFASFFFFYMGLINYRAARQCERIL